MHQERFSSLALLHIRREFDHDLDKIIDIFALKKHRRMKFIDILDDNEENENKDYGDGDEASASVI